MNIKKDESDAKSLYSCQNYVQLSRADQVKNSNFFNTINFLIYLKDPCRLSGENCAPETLSGLEAIIEINLKYSITFDYLESEKKKIITEILIDYLKFNYENIKDSLYKCGQIYKKENRLRNNFYNVNRSEKHFYRLEIFNKFANIMWNWADKSPEFCIIFHELNGIRVLYDYLNDNTLLQHLIKKTKADKAPNRFVSYKI